MAIVVYATGFSALVFHPSKVVNIILHDPQKMQLSFFSMSVLIDGDAGKLAL